MMTLFLLIGVTRARAHMGLYRKPVTKRHPRSKLNDGARHHEH